MKAANQVFEELKSILQPYEENLTIVHDTAGHYYLNTPAQETQKKEEFFGAAQIKKKYVAFHLMPIYYYPELLNSVSEKLKGSMQGKSCFNFTSVDKTLFQELKALIEASFEKYRTVGKV